jgi:hypothetical protein
MKREMSRRQFGKTVAAGMSGAVLAASAGAQPGQKSTVPVSDDDIRLRLIEQSRGKPLTAEQRKAILENIRNSDKQWAEGRKFEVPDNTEPAIVFTPTPLTRERSAK